MKIVLLSFMSLFLTITCWAAKPSANLVWPKEFTLENKKNITMFQPQVESLSDGVITANVAFKFTQNKKDFYGSFKLQGKALINKEKDLVTLSDMKVAFLNVPVGQPLGQVDTVDLQNQIQKLFERKQYDLSYQSLIRNYQVQVSETNKTKPDFKNDVPQFIYTTKPAILVMISGEPVWGDSKGASEVKRVLNTSALILHEDKKNYFIFALGKWFSSSELAGTYNVAKEPSSKYVMIKDSLVKEKKIDPMSGKTASGGSIYPPGVTPTIYISTKPAELLQSEGEPQYQAISRTSLLYMSNSPNSIFIDSKTQNYFVLVTGRWFSTKNLKEGPWTYIDGKKLPKDFAKIPANSPVAEALVSVPGTPQAKQAEIVSNIPQMAQVPKTLKPKDIECDGAVKWDAIPSSTLKYSENCNTPIIEVTDKQFYAVQDGVWFTSTTEKGPWNVAVVVPDSIYKIPSSVPVYYVTYVHVYNSSNDYVTVGYTPGYHGTFVSADGTIVYGTGYVYPAYISTTAWYPPPATYGFGVGYGWGYSDGFFMGFAMGAMMAPWGWGSCCWGGTYVNVHVTNVYHNWGTHTIVTGPGGAGFNVNSIGNTQFARAHGGSEIYADHNGQIYRRNPGGQWQQYQGPGTWDNINKKDTGSLENMHQSRNVQPARQNVNMPERFQTGSATPTQLRGGGMRAYGGGFHGGGFRR